VKTALTVPLLPSVTVTSLIERSGTGSLSLMVSTAPAGVPKLPLPKTLVSVRLTVSSGSSTASFVIATLNVWEATPSGKIKVPDAAV
jgi:hypothetical protein